MGAQKRIQDCCNIQDGAVLETPLGAGTEKGQFAFDYCHKIMMRVGVYFKQEIQSNTYHDQTKRLH